MYYGIALDMEVKPTIACNRAVQLAQSVIGSGAADQTAPSLWTTQRHPWNPGSTNFGPQYGYQQRQDSGDFAVWSFVYDVSGPVTAVLKYRIDSDGQNPVGSVQNETYAGGGEVGPWLSLPMTRRVFPAGNVFNDPGIDFFVMPTVIAEQVSARIVGVRDRLVDYYIEATDPRGNVRRGEIQHVYVGTGSPSGGGGSTVELTPAVPIAGQAVTVTYNAQGRALSGAASVRLHCGFNNWNQVVAPDPIMTNSNGVWVSTVLVPPTASQLDVVFNNGAGLWDNNGGQDWHFAVTGSAPIDQWEMDGVRDTDSVLVAQNGSMRLWAGMKGDVLYVAANDAGEGNDHFVFVAAEPGAMITAPWAKAGRVAAWSCFLADENNNDYEGWFDTTASPLAATGSNGGVLEGTIDLRAELGELPESIFLAVGPFATADGGALVWGSQVPTAISANGEIDAGEYVPVRLCEIGGPLCCPADFNRDGAVDGDDVIGFFGAWDNAAPGADANTDGAVDGDDVIEFFRRWDTGC
ncbi:MAG: GC-type dockerin domain-anchored protein, partial [Phycisphaerales bacterium]